MSRQGKEESNEENRYREKREGARKRLNEQDREMKSEEENSREIYGE